METLKLRLFVECPDVATAIGLLHARILPALDADMRVEAAEVRRYWKIEEWLEIALRLTAADGAGPAFDRLVTRSEAGWTAAGADRDVVWNPDGGLELFVPEVRWAHLELLPPDDA